MEKILRHCRYMSEYLCEFNFVQRMLMRASFLTDLNSFTSVVCTFFSLLKSRLVSKKRWLWSKPQSMMEWRHYFGFIGGGHYSSLSLAAYSACHTSLLRFNICFWRFHCIASSSDMIYVLYGSMVWLHMASTGAFWRGDVVKWVYSRVAWFCSFCDFLHCCRCSYNAANQLSLFKTKCSH